MELLYPSLCLLSFLLLLLFKLTSIFRQPSNSREPKKLPPGPWQLPIIGSIHHLLGFVPHRRFRDLSRIYGPIMHLKLGEVSIVVISSSKAAREIMKTQDITFATRPLINAAKIIAYNGQGLIFAPYGEFWRQLRKICVLELLSAKRVQSFQSIREEEVHNLIRSISSSSLHAPSVNLSEKLYSLANDITMRAVIGNKCKDQATFLSTLSQSAALAGGFDLGDIFPSIPLLSWISGTRIKLERCHRKLDRILEGIIKEHRDRRMAIIRGAGIGLQPEDEDLLDVLLRVQEEDNPQLTLTTVNIKAIITDILGAGSETSATALGWAMTELVRNPRVMKKVQSEIRGVLGGGKGELTEANLVELKYMKLVIKETLRLHVPVPLLLPRECHKTCEVLGYEVPGKARVVVNAWAIGRDPRYWGDDSEEFKPERFEGSHVDFNGTNFEFIPFGAGRRMCPGMSFGLATVELPLAQLLYYFDWELPEGAKPENLDMGETLGVTAKKKSDLCLRVIPCIPSPTT